MLNDSRLTTFDNPYDPFDQFVEWYMFDTEKGYNTCGKLDRITHYSEDMTEKEIDEPRIVPPFVRIPEKSFGFIKI